MRQARCSAVVGEVKAACLTSIIVLEECDEVIFGSSNIGHFLRPFVHIFGCHDHRDHTRMTARQPRKNRMKEEWIWYRSSSIFRNQCIRKAVTQQIIEFSFKKVLNSVPITSKDRPCREKNATLEHFPSTAPLSSYHNLAHRQERTQFRSNSTTRPTQRTIKMITNSIVQIVLGQNRRKVRNVQDSTAVRNDNHKAVKTRRPSNKIEHCSDAFHSQTIPYGDPEFEAQRIFRGHHNQGYFSKKTKVAGDRLYQRY